MRRRARDLLDEPLPAHGGVREGPADQVDNVKLAGGNGEDYTRRRLRRDRPDLYDRVLAGQLSADVERCRPREVQHFTPAIASAVRGHVAPSRRCDRSTSQEAM